MKWLAHNADWKMTKTMDDETSLGGGNPIIET